MASIFKVKFQIGGGQFCDLPEKCKLCFIRIVFRISKNISEKPTKFSFHCHIALFGSIHTARMAALWKNLHFGNCSLYRACTLGAAPCIIFTYLSGSRGKISSEIVLPTFWTLNNRPFRSIIDISDLIQIVNMTLISFLCIFLKASFLKNVATQIFNMYFKTSVFIWKFKKSTFYQTVI